MNLPESYYAFAEHMHALEEERLNADHCVYERPTGDKRWPVLCDKDGKYATRSQCDKCKTQRRESNAEPGA